MLTLSLSVFYPIFIGLDRATVGRVADHIEHIASVCGRAHVGIASDFDGMYSSVEGLEDASKYPQLVSSLIIPKSDRTDKQIMELLDRGWSDDEIKGVMGENLLRVMDAQDAVKESLKHEKPARDIYEKRQDLPAPWGGEDNKYLPTEVRKVVHARRQRDEL
jgi:membrane dipeptidase